MDARFARALVALMLGLALGVAAGLALLLPDAPDRSRPSELVTTVP